MAQTLTELLSRLNEFISDPNNQKFLEPSKIRAINTVLQGEVSSKVLGYARSADIQFRDGTRTYDFPEDMIEPVAIMIQELTGEVIVNSSWKSLVGNVDFNAAYPLNSDIFWQVPNVNGGKLMLRDIVPSNQFIITPIYDSAQEAPTVYTQATIPASASGGSIWVDSYDQDYVYKASASYGTTTDYANLTIDADSLATGTVTDLVFTSVTAGLTYNQVVLEVTLSASSVATTGTGTRADPYVVTFSLNVSDNSNDKIIALAATTSVLTAAGADATSGLLVPIAATDLDNDASQYWTPQYIHIVYQAPYPKLYTGTDELDRSIPVRVREGDCIPLLAAAKLLKNIRGDERAIIQRREFEKEGMAILDDAKYHLRETGSPPDLVPV